jgi:hypothetical protein
MELSLKEEAQIHALSDAELAAVFAIAEVAEASKCSHQECGADIQKVQHLNVDMFGPPSIVQQLRVRIHKLHTKQNSWG